MNIKIRLKEKPECIKIINESSFDDKTMEKIEDKKSTNSLFSTISSIKKKSPSLVSYIKENFDYGSLTHNGKLDEGSVANLLDIGLTKAKKRSLKRIKRFGKAFNKAKIKLGKRKVKRRIIK